MAFNAGNHAPSTPFTIGMRVCLNPESPNYADYNDRQTRGNAGFVFKTSFDETEVRSFLHMSSSQRAGQKVEVEWDNGHRNTYNAYDLLQIEHEGADVVCVRLSNSGWQYGVEGKMSHLDELIIQSGERITKISHFDKNYRDKMVRLAQGNT